MTAPAAISWAAYLGWLHLGESWIAFLGYVFSPWIFTVLAIAELISDQLPSTPSRKVPMQFCTRIVAGALCGAAVGIGGGWVGGWVIGAVIGTLGGAEIRGRLAKRFGQDRPAALIEDAIAIVGAFLIIVTLP